MSITRKIFNSKNRSDEVRSDRYGKKRVVVNDQITETQCKTIRNIIKFEV